MLTKEDIVNDLLSSGFEIDGTTDYRRVVEFCKQEYKVALSNRAVWAIINQLKEEGLAVLDFD
jgi:hypothetical protein